VFVEDVRALVGDVIEIGWAERREAGALREVLT